MTREDFIRLLCAGTLGHAWCINLLVALRSTACCSDCTLPVFDHALKSFSDGVAIGLSASPENAYSAMISVTKDTPLVGVNKERKAFRRAEVASHVTDLDTMRDFHFHLTADFTKTFIDSGLTDHSDRKRIVDEKIDPTTLTPRVGARVGLRRMWIAPSGASDPTGDREAASVARDERGLVHFGLKHRLVLYEFEPTTPVDYYKPTVMDGTGRRFSALPDGADVIETGMAIDLFKLASGLLLVDGVPEALLSSPVVDSKDITGLFVLGSPGSEPHPYGVDQRGLTLLDDDAAFLAALQKKNKSTVNPADELCRLMNDI